MRVCVFVCSLVWVCACLCVFVCVRVCFVGVRLCVLLFCWWAGLVVCSCVGLSVGGGAVFGAVLVCCVAVVLC